MSKEDTKSIVPDKVRKARKTVCQCQCKNCKENTLRLEDEVESLWFMLDEIKESQKFTKEHGEEMQKQINKQLAQLKLMQMRRGEA